MSSSRLQRAEFWALLAVLFLLPIVEAPKNIAIVAYVSLWILNRYQRKEWGGKVCIWDGLPVTIVLAAILSVAFGAFSAAKGVLAVADVMVFSIMFILVRRSKFSEAERQKIYLSVVIGVAVALIAGYVRHLGLYGRETYYLELLSVGHVNHSAIYLSIVLVLAASWLIQSGRDGRNKKVLLWSGVLFLATSLIVMSSRGALVAVVVALAIISFVAAKAISRKLLFVMGVALGVAMIAIANWPGVQMKNRDNIASGDLGSLRPNLAKTSLETFRMYPVFGVGKLCFGQIGEEKVRAWQDAHGAWFDIKEMAFFPHAHNLYFNTLAEQGLVGLAAILAFVAFSGNALWRERPRDRLKPGEFALWGGAFGAWCMTAIGGLFNTSLHHEHALITMILIALWMSEQRTRGKEIGASVS